MSENPVKKHKSVINRVGTGYENHSLCFYAFSALFSMTLKPQSELSAKPLQKRQNCGILMALDVLECKAASGVWPK